MKTPKYWGLPMHILLLMLCLFSTGITALYNQNQSLIFTRGTLLHPEILNGEIWSGWNIAPFQHTEVHAHTNTFLIQNSPGQSFDQTSNAFQVKLFYSPIHPSCLQWGASLRTQFKQTQSGAHSNNSPFGTDFWELTSTVGGTPKTAIV